MFMMITYILIICYWDKPVKEFFDSYQVEIRELKENETITKE